MTSEIIDIDALSDPTFNNRKCRGCDDRIRITTALPWHAIDHSAWKYEQHSGNSLTLISRSTCFDAAAAAAAVEALCEINKIHFHWEDVFNAQSID
jgi:hypothetical protein